MLTRPKTRPTPDWEGFLVLNADKVVLGVYGSALYKMARQQVAKLRPHHPLATVKLYVAKVRPSVGDTVA